MESSSRNAGSWAVRPHAALGQHDGALDTAAATQQSGARAETIPHSVQRMMNRIGCGYVALNRNKRVVEWNASTRAVLGIADTPDQISAGLRRLIGGWENVLPGSILWVVMSFREGRPVMFSERAEGVSDGVSIVALLDRTVRPEPNPLTLQEIFGLTSAETRLAIEIARGGAPLEIARSHRLSRTTIRSQLASLFAKTETNRQAELVALLDRISVLP
ncbi:helix-turn-helix transcriptional regulator [Rhizobium sp. ARZ01]|uniref:helix-turn-helix transcriptional regulator n=1 Tax=Rhizobium sp. ARZ01 TaxID=2769313 RepID=UPI00177B4DBA|nr:helix-turn-helix transcriptional regulator [Rhizobium sp. ARZ01]MBD9375234.1 helix-turn-helix transcriptional regulator [Rhizobium sp. ARZ01]